MGQVTTLMSSGLVLTWRWIEGIHRWPGCSSLCWVGCREDICHRKIVCGSARSHWKGKPRCMFSQPHSFTQWPGLHCTSLWQQRHVIACVIEFVLNAASPAVQRKYIHLTQIPHSVMYNDSSIILISTRRGDDLRCNAKSKSCNGSGVIPKA